MGEQLVLHGFRKLIELRLERRVKLHVPGHIQLCSADYVVKDICPGQHSGAVRGLSLDYPPAVSRPPSPYASADKERSRTFSHKEKVALRCLVDALHPTFR